MIEMEAFMPKCLKWFLIEALIFALVLTGVLALVVLVVQPNLTKEIYMPKDGSFTFQQKVNGELEISWPVAEDAEYYLFQIYQLPNDGQLAYQNDAGKLVYEMEVHSANKVILPIDAFSGNMLFKVRSAASYQVKGETKIVLSENAVETVTRFEPPAIEEVTYQTNSEKLTATIQLKLTGTTAFDISVRNAEGKWEVIKSVNGSATTLKFGTDGDLPMPDFRDGVQLQFTICRKGDGVVYYGTDMAQITIDRASLVPSDIWLAASYTQKECILTWQEEECDFYEIQQLNTETNIWEVIALVNADEARQYVLQNLPEELMLIRVAAAYNKEKKDENGKVITELKYRSISNEVGVAKLAE